MSFPVTPDIINQINKELRLQGPKEILEVLKREQPVAVAYLVAAVANIWNGLELPEVPADVRAWLRQETAGLAITCLEAMRRAQAAIDARTLC